MSRAEVHAFGSGSPEALVKVEWVMPNALARRVIISANRSSDPPSISPSAAAASLADLVTSARMPCSTVSCMPGISPILVGSIDAACPEIGTSSSRPMRRSRSASNTI